MNSETGQVLVVDRLKARVARMQRVGAAWAGQMWPLVQAGLADWVVAGMTLRPGVEWYPGMASEFMRLVERYLGDDLYGYVVIPELQRRGAVHLNVVLCVRKGRRIPMPDKAGWWPHGTTKVRTGRRGDLGYFTKSSQKGGYIDKDDQKGGSGGPSMPKGIRLITAVVKAGRTAGAGLARVMLRLAALPRWLFERIGYEAVVGRNWPVRAPGGGWMFGGVLYRSPWVSDWELDRGMRDAPKVARHFSERAWMA